jgi:hypothetical protein
MERQCNTDKQYKNATCTVSIPLGLRYAFDYVIVQNSIHWFKHFSSHLKPGSRFSSPSLFKLSVHNWCIIKGYGLDLLLPVQSVPITVFEIRLSNLLIQELQN